MKKLLFIPILLLVLFRCSPDEETICTDSELGVNCQGADYIQNSDSPYVLPWEIGKTFSVGQSNCTDGSHSLGQIQFAYDINMPIGTNIVAMRSGIVVKVIESYEDLESGTVGLLDEANLINVKHDDGTEAQYVHLTLNGALKNEGDSVVQGEVIALSGNTGKTTGPHLHYEVLVNNKRTNSQRLKLPSGKKLSKNEMENFNLEKKRINQLAEISKTNK